MSEEKKPILSDDVVRFKNSPFHVRDFYEDLITSGKLRVVDDVMNCNSAVHYFTCSGCGSTIRDPYYSYPPHHSEHGGLIAYCPGCGNKIKRQ